MALGVVSVLVVIGIPVALVALVVRASRQGGAAGEHGGWSLRRFLQYGFLLAAVLTAAVGLTGLLETALVGGARMAGRRATDLALGLSLTLVGVPVAAGLWRLVHRHLAREPGERAAPAWSLYLAAAATVSLVTALVGWVQVGSWAVGVGSFPAEGAALALVWTAVWALHAWLRHDPRLAPTGGSADLGVLAGSAVGVVALAIGVGGVLHDAFHQLLQSMTGADLIDVATDALRRSLVLAVLAAAVWWWHWLRAAARGPRAILWHAYVLFVPILGGLVVAVVAAALVLHTLLQWFVGVPDTSAAAHFGVLPPAAAAALVGTWAWWYHRAVLGEAERRRTEPERVYEYLVAAVSLVAAATGVAVTLVAVVEALAPAPLATLDPSGRNTLVTAITLLLVGAPLWAVFWRRLQGQVASGDAAELASPSRRAYLFLLFGATGLTAVVSVIVMLYSFLRDLLEASLSATLVYDLRVAAALALTAGAVSGYHWTVFREDRRAHPQDVGTRRTVLLLSPDGRQVGDELASRTGASVRSLHRLDAAGGPVDIEAVVAAVLAETHERLLVVVDGDGTVTVIPYEGR